MLGFGTAVIAAALASLIATPLLAGTGAPPLWAGPATSLPVQEAPRPPEEIVGGEVVTDEDYIETVYLRLGSVACTGTLVSERLVLTAGHCLAGITDLDRVCVLLGDEVVPQACWGSSGRADVASYGVYPDYCPGCEKDAGDLGYLWLEQTVTGLEYPSVITDQAEYEARMFEGAKVELVGYGYDESGSSDGKKRQVRSEITEFVSKGREFFAGGDGKDTCSGDSGGPAFIRTSDGSLRLVGITSRGYPTCGDGGLYTAPFQGLCWVRDETGVDLLPEGCEDCSCVDLSQTGGCGCDTRRGGGDLGALALFGLLLWRRRPRARPTA